MKNRTLCSIAMLMVACASAASTAAVADTAKDYNLFVLGNYTASGSDTEGRVAVGGNANISSYSVGALLTDAANSQANLVVGGALTFNSGSVAHGGIVAGSIAQLNNIGLPNGTASTGASPVDFAAEKTRLLTLSQTLATNPATGIVTNYYGGLFLTGSNPGLNVFNVSGAQLSGAWGFNIDIPVGSYALFNVSGVSDQLQYFGFGNQKDPSLPSPAFTEAALDPSHLLFNFADATSLSLNGVGVPGTILAPKADITLGYLQINGTVIANSVTGPGQINLHPYAGTLLDPAISGVHSGGAGGPVAPVPEPAAWAMMILGVGLTGAALRSRRRRALV